jgi:hypothetical protein
MNGSTNIPLISSLHNYLMKKEQLAIALVSLAFVSGMVLTAATSGCTPPIAAFQNSTEINPPSTP